MRLTDKPFIYKLYLLEACLTIYAWYELSQCEVPKASRSSFQFLLRITGGDIVSEGLFSLLQSVLQHPPYQLCAMWIFGSAE